MALAPGSKRSSCRSIEVTRSARLSDSTRLRILASMRTSAVAIALAILFTFALSVGASAQISYLNGTGCKNAANTPVVGSSKIGQTLTVAASQLPCNSPGTFAFVLLNFSCGTIPNLMFGCGQSNPCTMMAPIDLSFFKPITASVNLPIPNDTMLIGGTFCVQGGCLSTFGGTCVAPLGVIAQIKIQA